MRKGVSISLSLLMLVAILHISVATHYCGGKEAGMKVSLSGKLASCGMEDSEIQLPVHETNISNHCCENIITFCGTDNNYSPTYSFLTEPYQHNLLIWSVPAEFPIITRSDIRPTYAGESPPGAFVSTSVDLSDICVLRI